MATNDAGVRINRRGPFEIDCTLHGDPVPFLGAGCDCPRDVLENRARWLRAEAALRAEIAVRSDGGDFSDFKLAVQERDNARRALNEAINELMNLRSQIMGLTVDRDTWKQTATRHHSDFRRLFETTEAIRREYDDTIDVLNRWAHRYANDGRYLNNAESHLAILKLLVADYARHMALRERIEDALAPAEGM